ncbi:peptidase M20 [Neobacillus sp. LXY-1]|uniref:peptidase M20 n=1 Tax=Neobacillus sp. LXY-1 TaxID=3379133 RepID=UPI003EE413D8
MVTYANEAHGINLAIQHYFPGMSDLSFVGMQMPVVLYSPHTASMSLWGKEYSLPLVEISELNLSVLNLGPLGKDAHQWTERLDINHAFETLYDMLPKTIQKLLKM